MNIDELKDSIEKLQNVNSENEVVRNILIQYQEKKEYREKVDNLKTKISTLNIQKNKLQKRIFSDSKEIQLNNSIEVKLDIRISKC